MRPVRWIAGLLGLGATAASDPDLPEKIQEAEQAVCNFAGEVEEGVTVANPSASNLTNVQGVASRDPSTTARAPWNPTSFGQPSMTEGQSSPNSASGQYKIRYFWDAMGRLIGRADYTDHTDPDNHAIPHFHWWDGDGPKLPGWRTPGVPFDP